jgi:uncharacterized LabA/DUF88 family protein
MERIRKSQPDRIFHHHQSRVIRWKAKAMIDIPQNILNKFIVREDYLECINRETLIMAYLDLSNMMYWQDVLGWKFRIEDIVAQLHSFVNIKEVKIYFGRNEYDEESRKNADVLEKRILKTGAILRTKPVKYIKKTPREALLFKRSTRNLFNADIQDKLSELINRIKKCGLTTVNEPKCNFDVEIAMDMMDDTDKMTAAMLFSGDSDLVAPLERLKVKNKKIFVVGVRGMVADELHRIKDKYIDFGKFYTGKRNYPAIKSENPACGGTA